MQRPKRLYYFGSRDHDGEAVVVTPRGGVLDPRPDLRCYGADGFDWPHQGEGSAQLALAVLADFLLRHRGLSRRDADALAEAHHQEFRKRVVAGLPRQWRMDARVIDEFASMLLRSESGGEVNWGLWSSSLCERCLVVAVEGRVLG